MYGSPDFSYFGPVIKIGIPVIMDGGCSYENISMQINSASYLFRYSSKW